MVKHSSVSDETVITISLQKVNHMANNNTKVKNMVKFTTLITVNRGNESK